MTLDFTEALRQAQEGHQAALDRFVSTQSSQLERLAHRSHECLARGGKLLFFGNGGSAALAQELAAEFVNRYEATRPALAALALTTDASVVTSIANDTDFQEVFARQIEALGRPGDLAVGISTSGNSPNLCRGLIAARDGGLAVAALLGRDGGKARGLADITVQFPGSQTSRIQEVQIFAGHVLCGWVEQLMVRRDSTSEPRLRSVKLSAESP